MDFIKEHQKLLFKKKELYIRRRELESKLRLNAENLENVEDEISKNCLFFNKKHDWICEREDGPYGEIFRTCKNCGIER